MMRASLILLWASETFSRVCTPEDIPGDVPIDTRRCCDVESTPVTLIQRCNNVVCPVEYHTATDTSTPIVHTPIDIVEYCKG